jgi:hypothetical protein
MATETADRVRANTSDELNTRLDHETEARIRTYAAQSPEAITRRIEELEREWDMERLLETNASTLAFVGLALGAMLNKKFLLIPAVVLPFLFQHAVQGWCPPVPVFRRLGVRTREEIDAEKYALKALRGDFDRVPKAPGSQDRAHRAYEAARA